MPSTTRNRRIGPSRKGQSSERSKDNPWIVNSICRQCHASESGAYPDGSGHTNSRESLELDAGACISQIACNDCHNPHEAGPPSEAGPDNPKHLEACLGCHSQYREPAAARAHAKHDAEQASCLDCHMPSCTSTWVMPAPASN